MSEAAYAAANALRVAIVGSGPAGFYAAERLFRAERLGVQARVDMLERLPTPYGLVRGGVAPDHQKIKSVTKVYDRIASHERFRFFGNVCFGEDITRAELLARYHGVIYAVGAQSDRALSIPGEDLAGSHAATEFVAWYNGHPDYYDREFDLSATSVAVIGLGNVAMDVVRILARSQAELDQTDIANYAQRALAESRIREIYVLGRRGPAQSAFTNPEIKELGEMEEASIVVTAHDMALDEHSEVQLATGQNRTAVRNVEILREYSRRPAIEKRVRIVMRFLTSPVELLGEGHVEAMRLVRNELYQDERGNLRSRATEETDVLPVQLVFRSVGYRGVPLPGLPFDEGWGTIPNARGRLTPERDSDAVLPGEYVAGWIKRGPTGVIGTNKPDSVETVECLLEDWRAGRLSEPAQAIQQGLPELLGERGVQVVNFADWQRLDAMERERGSTQGRPRVKFHNVPEMLALLRRERETA